MKVLIFAMMIVLTIMLIAGCGPNKIESEISKNDNSMFKQIERTSLWIVVYHTETKVMYSVSYGGTSYGTFTLLVNPDGSPMLYEG